MSTELKMDAEIKRKWVEALRSGEFKQGQTQLARRTLTKKKGKVKEVKHCCLGVLCEVVGIEGKPDPMEPETLTYLGEPGVLPDLVHRGVGLPSIDPTILLPNRRVDMLEVNIALSTLNDSGFTFPQIADIIDYFIEGD